MDWILLGTKGNQSVGKTDEVQMKSRASHYGSAMVISSLWQTEPIYEKVNIVQAGAMGVEHFVLSWQLLFKSEVIRKK